MDSPMHWFPLSLPLQMAAMQGKKNHTTSTVIKGQTIRKLMGGGGEGKVQKKYLRKGKLN